MRKCISIVAAGLLAFGSVHASPILVDPTVSGSSANAQITSSTCLYCFVETAISDDLDATMAVLDIGDSFTFDFFDIVVGALFGTAQVQVDATLALALESQDETATASGFGGFASLFYVLNAGQLTWIQPDAIDLGDGTILGVSFEDLFEFGIGNTATVSATISRYDAASAVPEPGTAALLIVGLLALWFASRRPTKAARRRFASAFHSVTPTHT